MSLTKIEWTGTPIPGTDIIAPGYTFNPWIGCTKVSPGCANCYAEAEDKRRGWTLYGWGPGRRRTRTSAQYWRQPLLWNERQYWWEQGERWTQEHCDVPGPFLPNVFCASLADWLDPEVPAQWLADLLAVIRLTPNLRWLLLSKRPELWIERMTLAIGSDLRREAHGKEYNDWLSAWTRGNHPSNVAVGTSVEDQQRADERIPHLLRTPARWRFLSLEPLLGPVAIPTRALMGGCGCGHCQDTQWPCSAPLARIHQLIIGGESGPHARPCNVEHVRSLVRQGNSAVVPVFVKQLGAKPYDPSYGDVWQLDDRKGVDPAEWPEDLRVREYLP